MKKYANAQDELREIFQSAMRQGKCHTQKQFAELVGLNPANLSCLLSGGAPVTEQMMKRIKDAAIVSGVILDQKENKNALVIGDNHGEQKILDVNAEGIVKTLTAEMAEQRKMYAAHVDRLLGIIEKMQQ